MTLFAHMAVFTGIAVFAGIAAFTLPWMFKHQLVVSMRTENSMISVWSAWVESTIATCYSMCLLVSKASPQWEKDGCAWLCAVYMYHMFITQRVHRRYCRLYFK